MVKKKVDYKFWISTAISVALIILLGVVIYGLTQGWFAGLFSMTMVKDTNIINKLNNPNSASDSSVCSIDLYPNVINSGDGITGTLNDGVNTFCEVYGYMEGDDVWKKVWEGTTDSNGKVVYMIYYM